MLTQCGLTRGGVFAIGVMLLAGASIAQGQAKRSPPRPTGGAMNEHPFVALNIPALPTRAEVLAWAEQMHLSEGQRTVFLGYYQAFMQSEAGKPAEQLTALWDWSAALGPVHVQAYSDVELAKDLGYLCATATLWVQRLIDAERNQLFEPMRSILAEQQQLLLTQAAQRRECAIYRIMECFHFSAKVDLIALLLELEDDQVVFVDDRAEVDAILAEYGNAMLRLWRGFAEARRDVSARGPALRAVARTGPKPSGSPLRRLRRRAADRATSICQFNEMYAAVLADALDARSRDVFLHEYRLRAHPQVYPNPYDPAPVFAAARELADLTPDQLQEIESLEDSIGESMDAVCDRMNIAIRKWCESFLRNWSFKVEAKQEQIETLTAAHAERKLVAESAVAELQQIIGEENYAAVTDQVTEFWNNAARLKPFEEGLHYFVAYAGAERGSP